MSTPEMYSSYIRVKCEGSTNLGEYGTDVSVNLMSGITLIMGCTV